MITPQLPVVVLKFGSSVLTSEDQLPNVVSEIYHHWREGAQVLVVVSAFGNTTDELLCRAQNICPDPDETALASLLATGEATASALLTIAIQKAGIPVRLLNAAQAGLRTSSDTLDARLESVDVKRLETELSHGVVVLPGFVGCDDDRRTTVLGRGGSDFTAVFVAEKLRGRCVLVKDVDGLYTSDPALAVKRPPRFAEATYETACRVAGTLIQPKAIRFAKQRAVQITAISLGATSGTKIGSDEDRVARLKSVRPPLKVALLGCGIVGGGVYQRFVELREFFSVIGVAVLNTPEVRQPHVLHDLLTDDVEALIERPCDVVVELIGGSEIAAELIGRALSLGKHVVTANKALIATDGECLHQLARENDVTLRFSAAVGGAVPALETIRRAKAIGPIHAIYGVLNGTTNFILDQLVHGAELQDAIGSAQKRGYAEADPTLDLNGTDAMQKLIILAREAFGVSLACNAVRRKGIEQLGRDAVRAASKLGSNVRLVASCERTAGGFMASVAPKELPNDHPLASVTGAQNRLLVELESGETLSVSGTGAGRWPTTEAVIADLLDIRREVSFDREEITQGHEECVA